MVPPLPAIISFSTRLEQYIIPIEGRLPIRVGRPGISPRFRIVIFIDRRQAADGESNRADDVMSRGFRWSLLVVGVGRAESDAVRRADVRCPMSRADGHLAGCRENEVSLPHPLLLYAIF